MRLLTFTEGGRTRAGFEIEGRVVDLAAAIRALPESQREGAEAPDSVLALLQGGDAAMSAARRAERWVAAELAQGRQPTTASGAPITFARDAVKLNAPIPRPGKIICLGQNYADHAAEAGHAPPPAPMYFAVYANSIAGPGDAIIKPPETQRLDYEAEFAFVIGKTAKRVASDQALDYVAGYMNLNDVSARDLQSETSQFFRGKGGDTWAPTGPYLVTKDEIPDPHQLNIRCVVNGEVLQSSNTRQLIFNINYLVNHLTKTVTLEPGDIVSTGTPSGVGAYHTPPKFLKAGDVVRVEIDGLGVLENPVVEE